ncbi:glutathione metabolism protein [Paramagnetospirillum kuznetsovii]|uniref:Glutathione metabolism protein n=1 Tax=Paramagnetospirillum kuznetsovii TaxID=2053833 RepID=A0A364P010_9PROT|nr:MAPEG family protein [Paramagnetospirillum kuznetsovii]RAU22497.1 glutathione metabolism protein [Paramagnetospirillum kuznetsovii]
MAPKIVASYALVLAVMFVVLTVRVVKQRYRAKMSLGDGGDETLQRAIRVHGNFAEFVPFCVVLIALAEMNGSPSWSIHVLGSVLILARLSHAYGITQGMAGMTFRKYGMIGTFIVLLGAALHAVIGG